MRAKGTDRSKRVYKNAGHDAKSPYTYKKAKQRYAPGAGGRSGHPDPTEATYVQGAATTGKNKGKATAAKGKAKTNRGMSSKVSDFKASGLSGKAFGKAVSMAAKNRGPANPSQAVKAKAQKSAGAKPATAVKGGTARKMAPTALAKGKGRGRVKK